MRTAMASRLPAVVALMVAVVVWGLSFLSIKTAVAEIPPMTLALFRFAIASALLLSALRIKEPRTRLRKKDLPRILLAGFVGVTLYFLCENNGVKLTSASAASIIVATVPILTLVAEAALFGARLTRRKVFAAAVSFVGVYLVVGANFAAFGNTKDLWGSVLMLGAAFSWVAYCFLTRTLARAYSHLALVAYQSVLATLTLVPLSLLEVGQWRSPSLGAALNVLFLGVACSALAYVLYVYAQANLGVALSSLFINFIPAVTVASGFFILGERLSPYQIMGGFLVTMSVILSEVDLFSRQSSPGSADEIRVDPQAPANSSRARAASGSTE